MALTDPVSQGDDDATVLKKLAVALGVPEEELFGAPDPSYVLRKACAAAQGVTWP
jgi:hypothetical protein